MEEILKNLNYQPVRLTKGDLKDPMGLIAYFLSITPFTRLGKAFGNSMKAGFMIHLNMPMLK